jgi:hypothetical protein
VIGDDTEEGTGEGEGVGVGDEEGRQRDRDRLENLISQISTLAQPGVAQTQQMGPAQIRYMYDIGGDSIFANPQQEALFASPYGARTAQAPVIQNNVNFPSFNPIAKKQKGGIIERNDDLLRLLQILGEY